MTSKPKSRPTTPLRRIERGGLSHLSVSWNREDPFPLDSLAPAFAEMTDALTDAQHNFEHIHSIYSNLVQFSESFASFLYGLNMNAFCVDFSEAPIRESFKRMQTDICDIDPSHSTVLGVSGDCLSSHHMDPHIDITDTTFTTNDTSFIERPSQSIRSSTPKRTSKSTNRSTRNLSFKTDSMRTGSSTRSRQGLSTLRSG
ncbi:hypothetical protein PCANB_002282 [Pneumocystis canis]|nr:hypothetical protein PCK1_002251 [Pneumocystis canis]KAG5438952.1 hypothetical protein PCANB_002282 [Pneumocystis canis]